MCSRDPMVWCYVRNVLMPQTSLPRQQVKQPSSSLTDSPLLPYIVYAKQSGTANNIKNAVMGRFLSDQVTEAKDLLWEACGEEILGTKHSNRRDDPSRTGVEAHVTDFLNALSTLEREEKMPTILIDAYSLSQIPRSHPEELNNIHSCMCLRPRERC